jgi:hypothetical protein
MPPREWIDLVLESCNREWALPAIRFRNVDAPGWQCPIRSPLAPTMQALKGEGEAMPGSSVSVTKLVLTFPDSQTVQQFSGWLYLEGYLDRVLEQNTVTVEVPNDERDNIIEEVESRNGRIAREHKGRDRR